MKHGFTARLCVAAFALACLIAWAPKSASAQTAQPLSACGTGPVYGANGLPMPLTQTTVGKLCTMVDWSDLTVTGTVTSLNAVVTVSSQGRSTVGVDIATDTNVTWTPECLIDGVTERPLQAFPIGGGAAISTIATTGGWAILNPGCQKIELKATSVGATPSSAVTLNASNSPYLLGLILAAQATPGCTVLTVAAAGTNGQQLAQACDPKGGLITQSAGPVGTQVTGHSGDVAATAAVATLTATASTTAYIDGFQCYPFGATGASVILIAVTGTIGGTMTYPVAIPAGATTQLTPVQVAFAEPVAASAINTNIVVTMPSNGAGNLHASCNAQGHLF